MTQVVTAPSIRARKGSGEPLVMVTAYDAPGARIADAAGVDMILVGDSVAMVVLGYDDTLSVTVDDMAHHVAAVSRSGPGAMVIADLPWLSYHVSVEDSIRNAARLVRCGAQAVKLEGGQKRLPMVESILDAEIRALESQQSVPLATAGAELRDAAGTTPADALPSAGAPAPADAPAPAVTPAPDDAPAPDQATGTTTPAPPSSRS